MTVKQQIVRWAMCIILALGIYTAGFAAESVCERLQRTVGQTKAFYAENPVEEGVYMEMFRQTLQGHLEARRLDERLPLHLYMKHRDMTVLGEVWITERSDGLYVCEDSCDYVAGKLVKERDNRCFRIESQ
jgi:hypothetical protein